MDVGKNEIGNALAHSAFRCYSLDDECYIVSSSL